MDELGRLISPVYICRVPGYRKVVFRHFKSRYFL